MSSLLLAGLLLASAVFALADDPRLYESEYLLSPWYRGEALPGLVPTILPEGRGAPLVLLAEILYAINAEYQIDDDGSVRGRRHPGNMPFEIHVTGSWRLGREQGQLPSSEYRRVHNELYISADLLARIFPVSLDVDVKHQRLVFKASGPLPLDIARERERRRNRLLSEAITDPPPEAEFPYRPVGRLAGDLNLDYFHQSLKSDLVASSTYDLEYDGLLVSELAYNTGTLFFRGDQDELEDARLRMGQESPKGGAWGIPGLTLGYLGDVNGAAVPLVGTLSGRGGVVSNYPLDRPDQFDQTTIEGDAPAGWEVELYRESTLLTFSKVGPDGRYRFEDIPLLFGRNDFRVVFIGPEGQIREESRNFTVGNAITRPGELHWRAFAGEHQRRTLESMLSMPQGDLEENQRVYSVEGDLGLGRYASIGLFASRAPGSYLENASLFDTQGVSASLSLPGIALELDGATQTASLDTSEKGNAWGVGGSTALASLNLNWRHSVYDNFFSRRATYGASSLASESRVRASLPVTLGRQSLTLYGSGERWQFLDDNGELSTRAGARFRVGSVYINQELEWRRFLGARNKESQRRAWLPGASMNVGRLRLSLDGRYDIDTQAWRNTRVLGNWHLGERTNLTVSAQRTLDIVGDPGWTGSLSLSRDFRYARARAMYSSRRDGGYVAGLGLNFSFGMSRSGRLHFSSVPSAERGAADVRVYHDMDHDGNFDRGRDQLVFGAEVLAGEGRRAPKTSDQGRTYLNGLDTHHPVTLRIAPESISDPFLVPVQGGVTFTPRPGQPYPAEISLVESGEVSGRVLVERNGVKSGLASVSLALERLPDGAERASELPLRWNEGMLTAAYIDARSGSEIPSPTSSTQTYAVQQTQYDGSYLFDLIPPGKYRVRIQPDQSVEESPIESVQVEAFLSSGNLLVSKDILLLAPDDKERRPEVLKQRIRDQRTTGEADPEEVSGSDAIKDVGAQLVMGSFRDLEHGWTRAQRIATELNQPVWLVKVTLDDGLWYRVVTTWLTEEERGRWESALQSMDVEYWALTKMSAHYEIIAHVVDDSERADP